MEKKLDYISRQLGQLDIIKQLPDTVVRSHQLVNRATDVLSAALKYIAVHIRHASNPRGAIGILQLSGFII